MGAEEPAHRVLTMAPKEHAGVFLVRKVWLPALLITLPVFLVFGLVTAVIPNPFFVRMTPLTWLDYFLLVSTSLLIGLYLSVLRYMKKSGKCAITASGGGVLGFLGFSCVVCNKLLVVLLGVAGVLTYIEPYRYILGFGGLVLLLYAVASSFSKAGAHA